MTHKEFICCQTNKQTKPNQNPALGVAITGIGDNIHSFIHSFILSLSLSDTHTHTHTHTNFNINITSNITF